MTKEESWEMVGEKMSIHMDRLRAADQYMKNIEKLPKSINTEVFCPYIEKFISMIQDLKESKQKYSRRELYDKYAEDLQEYSEKIVEYIEETKKKNP